MSRLTPTLLLAILVWVASVTACSTSQPSTSADAELSEGQNTAQAETEPAQDTADVEEHIIRIAVDSEAIRVDGEEVVKLVDGMVPGVEKKGGESSMLITPMFEAVQQAAQRMKTQGEVDENSTVPKFEISTSPFVSYRVITEVMYSAGQAEVHRFEFVVEQPDDTSIHFTAVAPRLTTEEVEAARADDKLNLTAIVAPAGFMVGAKSTPVPTLSGCPKQGMPICLIDPDADVTSLVDNARDARRQGNTPKAMQLLSQVVESYDYRRLYNTLTALKKRYKDHPDSMNLQIGAATELPMATVARLVQAIRYQLPEEQYEDREEFRSAVEEVQGMEDSEEIFSEITFLIVM